MTDSVRWTLSTADDEEYAASVYRGRKPMTTLVIRRVPSGGYGIHIDGDPDTMGAICTTLQEAVRRADSYIDGYLAALEQFDGEEGRE
jgi:predicted RNase H-like HicB family nuclease